MSEETTLPMYVKGFLKEAAKIRGEDYAYFMADTILEVWHQAQCRENFHEIMRHTIESARKQIQEYKSRRETIIGKIRDAVDAAQYETFGEGDSRDRALSKIDSYLNALRTEDEAE